MTRHIITAMLLLATSVQTTKAQKQGSTAEGKVKVVLHMKGNQKAEYDVSLLDSINFVEVDSSGENPSTDPSVTGDAIDITNKSATLVGYASSIRESLANDLRVGFIYCLEGTPNKNNGTQVTVNKSDVADDGRYMAMIENLLSETTYYFRSFVYQSGLWFYGKVKSFITAGIDVNFSTGDATDVTCFSAKVSGSVDVQSTYSSLTYGICYGTSIEPTTNDNTQTASSNNFTLQLRQLTGGTTYYYRPYAIVDGQTYYGTVHTFRTLTDNVVETGTIDEETLTVTSHLTIGGGAYSSLVLGVCYGTTESTTIDDNLVTSDEVDEDNNYTVRLVNVNDGIIYYRAYVLIDGVPHYGAVNNFYFDADYRSVVAPANLSNTFTIMRSAIYDGYMGLNYEAYLKDMQSHFTFLMPDDYAMYNYYDPVSMKSRTPRVLQFYYKNVIDTNTESPVKSNVNNYYGPYNKDKGTLGTIGSQVGGQGGKIDESEVINRLKDILETHTIVHDKTNPMTHEDQEKYGIDTSMPLDEYYHSKNGCPVKVVRDENDNIIAFKGGFQLENEHLAQIGILNPGTASHGVLSCEPTQVFNLDNGHTYILNAPLVPTYRSVYSILTNDADMKNVEGTGGETPYSRFYELCTASGYETEIVGCGLVDRNLSMTQRESALKEYKVFISDNGLDYNVQFFNNYRYTVFVPTNEAIQDAIAHGLPTWEDIYADYHSHCKPELEENDEGTAWVVKTDEEGIVYSDSLATLEDSVRIAAKITYLTNFIRYHFADNSVFADKTVLAPNEMVTSSYDREIELFCKLHVDRVANGDGTDLRVCDDVTWKANGNSMEGATMPFVTLNEINGEDVRNVLARDLACSSSPGYNQSMYNCKINSSSAAVIHSIPGYLNHTALDASGRHDGTWKDLKSSRRYLKRYAIR